MSSCEDDPDVRSLYRDIDGKRHLDLGTLGPMDQLLVMRCLDADHEMEALGRPLNATLRALSAGARTVHNLSDDAPVGWRKLLTCNTGVNVEILDQYGPRPECAMFANWVLQTISRNGWGPDGNATPLGRMHSSCMAIATRHGGGLWRNPETNRFEWPDGSEAIDYEPPED